MDLSTSPFSSISFVSHILQLCCFAHRHSGLLCHLGRLTLSSLHSGKKYIFKKNRGGFFISGTWGWKLGSSYGLGGMVNFLFTFTIRLIKIKKCDNCWLSVDEAVGKQAPHTWYLGPTFTGNIPGTRLQTHVPFDQIVLLLRNLSQRLSTCEQNDSKNKRLETETMSFSRPVK